MKMHRIVNEVFCCLSLCFVIVAVLAFTMRDWFFAVLWYGLSWFIQLIRVSFFTIEIPELCVHPFMSKLSRNYIKAPLTFIIVTVATLYFFTFVFNRPDATTAKLATDSYNNCFNYVSEDYMTVTEFRERPVAIQWQFVESKPIMDSMYALLTTVQDIATKESYSEQDVIDVMADVDNLTGVSTVRTKSFVSTAVYLLFVLVTIVLLFFQQSWQSYLMYIEMREETL